MHPRRHLVQASAHKQILVQLYHVRGHGRPCCEYTTCTSDVRDNEQRRKRNPRLRHTRKHTTNHASNQLITFTCAQFRTKILSLYVIGNLISLVALTVSLIIFVSFK